MSVCFALLNQCLRKICWAKYSFCCASGRARERGKRERDQVSAKNKKHRVYTQKESIT